MVLPPVQEDRFYTIACWAHGKKSPIVNALEVLVWVFLTMDLSSQISLRAHCEQPLVVSIVQALAPDSDEELSPTCPSREVKRRRMNNFQLIQLFVYGNGRQIDGRPRTRTFDTTEEGGRRCTGFKAIQVEIVNIGTRQLFDPCVGLVTTRYVCTTHWSS